MSVPREIPGKNDCIERQNMSDAIHLEEHPTTLLKKGETYDEITSYQFKVIQ